MSTGVSDHLFPYFFITVIPIDCKITNFSLYLFDVLVFVMMCAHFLALCQTFLLLFFPVNHLYILHGLVGQITHLPNMLFKYLMTMNVTSLLLPTVPFVIAPLTSCFRFHWQQQCTAEGYSQSFFRLAMPVTEFVVAVHIWLGIPLFPTTQLCTCPYCWTILFC